MLSYLGSKREISIHALREEGDFNGNETEEEKKQFLSTPSARRATMGGAGADQLGQFLSTPSARRATTTSEPWAA